MNILIITPFYKHDRNIASVRWTNLGTRLAKRHNVIIVTQPHDDMDMNTTIETDEDGILVARINQKTGYERLAVKHFGGATGDDWQTAAGTGEAEQINDNAVRKLKNRALYASMQVKAKSYAKEIAKNVIPKGTKIDVVISSACPFIEMLFGYELKKLLGCKWISDFRDLPFTEDNCDDTHIEKRIMQKVLSEADCITTIAESGRRVLIKEIVEDKEKVLLVRNGFSMTDAREPITIDDDILHIVHTGSLYGGNRKADLLFKAIAIAKQKKPDFKYELQCAGGNNQTLIETAKKYNEEKSVINKGFISRNEALDLQKSADLLLALIYKTAGSFSAKLFEYTLNQKPIVCISNGENSYGEESEYINNLNLGIAVDELTAEQDVSKLADYLLLQSESKENNGCLIYNPNTALLEGYNIDCISKKFERIISTICS